MDKIRVLKHYAFQEVTAELLNSIGTTLFGMSDGIAQAFIAGFQNTDHLIFQEFDVTPDGSNLAVKCGLKGVILYRIDAETSIWGVYKGTRPDKNTPYSQEILPLAAANPTQPRIDILEAEIVEEDDTDYFETVQLFNPATETSFAQNKYTKRVRNVKLYIKTGTPSATPIAPVATNGRMTIKEIYVGAGVTSITPANIISQTFDPSQSLWSRNHHVILFPAIYEVIQYAKTTIAQNRTFEVERHDYKTIPGKYTANPLVIFTPPPSVTELTVELAGGGGGGSVGNPSSSNEVINTSTDLCGKDGTDSTIALASTGEVLMRAPGGKGGGTSYHGYMSPDPTQYVSVGGFGGGEYGHDGRRGSYNTDANSYNDFGIGGNGGGEYGGIAATYSMNEIIDNTIAWGIRFMVECGQMPIRERYLVKFNRPYVYMVDERDTNYSPGTLYGNTLRQTNLKADVNLRAMIPARLGLCPGGTTYFIREMYMFYSSRIDKVDVETGATISYPCNLTGLVKALPGVLSSSLEISLNEIYLVFPTKICKYAPGTPTIFAGSDTSGDVTGPNRLSARFSYIFAATYNDHRNELYVADGYKIKRIPLNTDVVETIIGTGVPGYSNDPIGTNAQISEVAGLVVIGTNLYIAEGTTGYANIRVCDLTNPTYPVQLLCGGGTISNWNVYGTGTSVRFRQIIGMYTFSDGLLYVIAINGLNGSTLDRVLSIGERQRFIGSPIYGPGVAGYSSNIESHLPRRYGMRGCGGAGGSPKNGVGGGGGGSSKVVGKITIPPGSTLYINLGQGGMRADDPYPDPKYFAGSGGHGGVKISW